MASKPEDEVTDSYVQHVPWPNENLESSSYTVNMGSSDVANDAEVQLVQEPNVNLEASVGGSNYTKEKDESNLSQEVQERVEARRQRGEPVTILVIGLTGSGKSTLINALMGDTVARVEEGAASVTRKLKMCEGKYKGVKIRVYDTVGFSDSKGKSDNDIVKEIAKANKFDLILICIRMDSRANDKVKKMFTVLCDNISQQMWERTVIVLTFANMFLQLGNIRQLQTTEGKVISMNCEIEEFRCCVRQYVQGSVTDEMFSTIPFCVAGLEDERKLADTDDWLLDLWRNCLYHSSDEARNFFTRLAEHRFAGVGAAIVAGITAAFLAIKCRFKRNS